MANEHLLAIGQHSLFLKKVNKCLKDQDSLDCNCKNYDECAFGQWLYQIGIPVAEQSGSDIRKQLLKEIEDLHKIFHEKAFLAIEKKNSNSEESKIIETEMLQVSTKMINKLLLLDMEK